MNKMVKLLLLGVTAAGLILMTPGFKTSDVNPLDKAHITVCKDHHEGCTFLTLFGEESSEGFFVHKTAGEVDASVSEGLKWLVQAQQANGGYGAGSHYYQNERDPHAVAADPATSAMVGMAFLRSGSTLKSGTYQKQIEGVLKFLLNAVENTPDDEYRITDLENTQIQTKLGQNIDVVLTAQFFSNLLDQKLDKQIRKRVEKALASCVKKIEMAQAEDGSIRGDGWAGVLQSSLANNALESAQVYGIAVDEDKLEKSREYQKQNYDAKSGKVNTERGAGVVLYSVTSSVRASAQQSKKAENILEKAKKDGLVSEDAELSKEVLEQAGLSKEEAVKLATGYQVFQSAKVKAQDERVLSGFGNNGGEEFLSYLQTGESIVIGGGNDWKKWYDNTSGRIVSIQNEDGSWNGHHCITSPVFCTATCVLILTIDQDIERLSKVGG